MSTPVEQLHGGDSYSAPPSVAIRNRASGEYALSTGPNSRPGGTTSEDPPTLREQEPDGVELTLAAVSQGRAGRYELLDRVGAGGMGVVYRAREMDLDRIVALKMIRRDRPAMSGDESSRFLLEARATAQLQHPNIVPVYAFGTHEGQLCFAMEFHGGGSLARQIGHFSVGPPAKAAALVEKVANAVHHAHTRRILHRDLKPGNILLDESNEPCVCDFGLSMHLDSVPEPVKPGEAGPGTPAYMAPEQAAGLANLVGPATDVWALGIILYEVLTGQRPFPGDDRDEVLDAIRTREPRPPRSIRPALDRSLQAVVLRCLNKNPNDRYSSAAALAEDLKRWRDGEPTVVRPESGPARGLRALRRHPVITSTLGLTMVFIVASVSVWSNMPAGTASDEPSANQLLIAENELAAGATVNLVGENGLPKWFHRRAGHSILETNPTEAGIFSVKGSDRGLVELLPTPPPSGCRFQVGVRLDQEFRLGEAGIYFSYIERATPDGPESWLARLSLAKDLATNEMIARMQLQRYREANPSSRPLSLDYLLHTRSFPVRGENGEESWSQLAVEVTPAKISTFCDEKLVGDITTEDLSLLTPHLLNLEPKYADSFPGCKPSGALGLYVFGANASYRKAMVIPLEQ
jgi:serine/threonine protein kinase